MGGKESKTKTLSKTEENITKNHSHNMNQTHLRQNECIQDPKKPFIELDQDTSNRLSKEICRIVVETKSGRNIGTGFILAFGIDLEYFYCLVTNDHVIGNESINNNQMVYITYEEYKTASIKLDRNKRYIKSFIDKKLDITVVEILDEDNISKKYYLYPELNIPINNDLINK